MHSDARRPQDINLERYIDTLDQRLRGEVTRVRRFVLPSGMRRFLRAVKIRALAVVQGGALAMTAIAVIVAVGIAPSMKDGVDQSETSILAAPTLKTESIAVHKEDAIRIEPSKTLILAAAERGLTR